MAFWDLNGRLKQPCECASAALTGESGGRGGSVSSLPIILCATGELDGAREVDGRSGPCFDTCLRLAIPLLLLLHSRPLFFPQTFLLPILSPGPHRLAASASWASARAVLTSAAAARSVSAVSAL